MKQIFREGYRDIRELSINEELRDVYRVVQLSRLLIVFSDREDKFSKVRAELENILY